MKCFKILICSFLLSLTSYNIFSQEDLPFGFKNIFLGYSLKETKEELLKNPDFGYHGDRDVSLIPGTEQLLIETDSSKNAASFLSRCWFQFYNEKLYIMTINFNHNKVDYYSIFTTFSQKYGNPNSLDPKKATWKNDDVTIILEKPLSIKYIDNQTYDELASYSSIQKSFEEQTLQSFLDEF